MGQVGKSEPGLAMNSANWDRARLCRLAFNLVAAGLIAQLMFNLIMERLGYNYPYTIFTFRPYDRWADFFKLVFAYPGDPIHQPVRPWGVQALVDFMRARADEMRGTKINPDHMPPLPTLLALLVRRAFSLFDPVLVFIVASMAGLYSLAKVMSGFARQQAEQLRWAGVALMSYPLWFAADRGHFFSLICAITLIAGSRRVVETRQFDWQALLLLALSCNLRPNVVIVPVMLVLCGQAGSFRDLVRLGFYGAAVLVLTMIASHLLYPHYGPAAWLAGLKDYNEAYIKQPLALGFMTSLPSLLNMCLGFSKVWTLLCIALAAIMGGLTVLAARAGRMTMGQVLFIALGLMIIAIPAFVDYHLLPLVLPVAVIATSATSPVRGDWLAFAGCIILLIPKNYLFGNDHYFLAWSYQVMANPMITLAAMIAVLAAAVQGHWGEVMGEVRRLKLIFVP